MRWRRDSRICDSLSPSFCSCVSVPCSSPVGWDCGVVFQVSQWQAMFVLRWNAQIDPILCLRLRVRTAAQSVLARVEVLLQHSAPRGSGRPSALSWRRPFRNRNTAHATARSPGCVRCSLAAPCEEQAISMGDPANYRCQQWDDRSIASIATAKSLVFGSSKDARDAALSGLRQL